MCFIDADERGDACLRCVPRSDVKAGDFAATAAAVVVNGNGDTVGVAGELGAPPIPVVVTGRNNAVRLETSKRGSDGAARVGAAGAPAPGARAARAHASGSRALRAHAPGARTARAPAPGVVTRARSPTAAESPSSAARSAAATASPSSTWKCSTPQRETSNLVCFATIDSFGDSCTRCTSRAEVAAAKPGGSVGGLVKIGTGCVKTATGAACNGNNNVLP